MQQDGRPSKRNIKILWRRGKKSDREQALARGQAGSSSDHLRVPPPPPPPPKPIGTRPKAAPKLQDVKDEADTFQCGVVWPSAGPGHWTDRAGDSRRLNRPKDERVAGDRSGASSSSTAPRLLPNEFVPAPFNDKTHDHKWEIVPALNSGDKLKIQIAICASTVAKHEGLADSKGTLCFLNIYGSAGGRARRTIRS